LRNAQECSLLSSLLGGGGGLSGGRGSGSGGLDFNAHSLVLSCNSLVLADGVLCSSGFGLSLEVLLAEDFSLGFVDSFDKHILVLELVTLGGEVKSVIHLAIDLLLLSIPTEQSTEDAKATHPQDLLGHTGVFGTLSLTGTLMATVALGKGPHLCAGARVSSNIFPHDQSVLDELPDILAGVGESDFAALIGVNPHALLTTLQHRGSQPLL